MSPQTITIPTSQASTASENLSTKCRDWRGGPGTSSPDRLEGRQELPGPVIREVAGDVTRNTNRTVRAEPPPTVSSRRNGDNSHRRRTRRNRRRSDGFEGNGDSESDEDDRGQRRKDSGDDVPGPALDTSDISDERRAGVVAQALEIARESPDGSSDPTISRILDDAILRTWSKVEANPDSHIMSKDDFAVFNFFQHRFVGNRVALNARRRYWDSTHAT